MIKRDDFFAFNADNFTSLFDLATRTRDVGSSKAYHRKTSKDYELWIDVPGVKKEAIQLGVENGILTVRAERYDTKQVHTRSVVLSNEYNEDEIEAKLEDGVLYIRVPLASKSKNKKIEIK